MRKIKYSEHCFKETNANQVRNHRSEPVNYLENAINIKSLAR